MPARRSLLALAALAAVTLLVTVARLLSDDAGTAPTTQNVLERETGTVQRVGQAADDVALSAVDGPREEGSEEPRSRREASILDDMELVSLDALLLTEGSDVPLAQRRIAVYDANGVRVSATTDERGRVRIDDLLAAGDVDLYVENERRTERPPTRAFPKDAERPTTDSGRHVVRHGDAADEPDVWRVRIPARFQVVVSPTWEGRGAPSCYGRAKGEDSYVRLDALRVTRIGGARAVVVRSPKAGNVESPSWSLDAVHGRDDRRLLHAVHVRSDGVYAGTLELPVVPTDSRAPLEVELSLAPSGDRARLEPVYGKHLAKHIDLLQRRRPRGVDEATPEHPRTDHSITGTITTSSGASIEGLRVRAVPPSQSARLGAFRKGEAAVQWTANGVGRFEITNLDETHYWLRISAPSKPLLRPEKLGVRAPSTDVRLEAIDDFDRITVGVRARAAGGGWLDGFTATLRAEYRGGPIEAGATALPLREDGSGPETTIVHRSVPSDAEFTVTVTRVGYEPCEVSKYDFGSEGDVWTATVTLCPVPPPPEPEEDDGG